MFFIRVPTLCIAVWEKILNVILRFWYEYQYCLSTVNSHYSLERTRFLLDLLIGHLYVLLRPVQMLQSAWHRRYLPRENWPNVHDLLDLYNKLHQAARLQSFDLDCRNKLNPRKINFNQVRGVSIIRQKLWGGDNSRASICMKNLK